MEAGSGLPGIEVRRKPVRRLVYDPPVPHPLQYFAATVPALDPHRARRAVSCGLSTDDVAMTPGEYAWALRLADRLGVTAMQAPGSHEACCTQPAGLAEALLKD